MLKFLRNKQNQKRVYWILAIVILPPFLLWGVVVQQEEKGLSALGTLEGHRVSAGDYLKSYHAVQHQALLLYGEQYKQIQSFINFKGEAWDRLLLLNYAKKKKISASDREVVDWLTKQPGFSSEKGEFDADFYKLYVDRFLKTDTRAFEEEVRQFLTIRKISRRFKTEKRFQRFVKGLRRKLKINVETYNKIFPDTSS